MSQNVELVRLAFEAFNRRDFDGALAVGDDSITWRPVFTLEGAVLKGKDAIRAWWSSQVETLDVRADPMEIIAVGESAVVAVARWTGAGRMSGTPFETVRAQVWEFEGGKVVHIESYATRAEALEAVDFRAAAPSQGSDEPQVSRLPHGGGRSHRPREQ